MENASKALYMAAGMLIALMILGMLINLFRAGGRVGESYEQKQSQEQLNLFNSKFENFNKTCDINEETGKSENYNTIIDMITVTNLAIDANKENDYASNKTVAIDIKLSSSVTLKVKADETLERNYLFYNDSLDEKIYVYDLISKRADSIHIYSYNEYNKLEPISFLPETMPNTDTLSMVNEDMRYKYWFKCTDIKYHETTGRVKYMKFELMTSTEYNKLEGGIKDMIWED